MPISRSRPRHSPKGLLAEALQHEESRHRERVASLQKAAARLAELDELAPELEQRGVRFHADLLSWSSYSRELFYGAPYSANRLRDALLALGFRQQVRTDHGTWQSVPLTRGLLKIALHVDSPSTSVSAPAAAPATTPATAPGVPA